MKYANLGTTGLTVSRICLGTMTYGLKTWRPWVLTEDQGRPFIKSALELGINFFDTADMYSVGESEAIVGRAVRDFAKRDDLVIATKVFGQMGPGPNDKGLSRKHIFSAIDSSLKRLGMEYVDLYQVHRWDYATPIEETMEALHDIVRAGKARYIGASSMFAYQFCMAQTAAERYNWTKFVSMQNHYNLVYREEEREMIPYCLKTGVGLIPWSPLARGFLSGNRKRDSEKVATPREVHDDFAHDLYYRSEDYDIVDRVVALAQSKGVSPAQVALAWHLQKPGIAAPIIGATKMAHLEEAVAAVDIVLTPEEVGGLEELYKPHPILGHR